MCNECAIEMRSQVRRRLDITGCGWCPIRPVLAVVRPVFWSGVSGRIAAGVRLNMYVTDVPAFMENAEPMVSMVAADGCTSVTTLLGVSALFEPTVMVELEATAAA